MTAQQLKFDMRQVVYYPGAKLPGTVIGRAEHLSKEPTYLVRPCNSESRTHGEPFAESELRAF